MATTVIMIESTENIRATISTTSLDVRRGRTPSSYRQHIPDPATDDIRFGGVGIALETHIIGDHRRARYRVSRLTLLAWTRARMRTPFGDIS
jgi:hypothetical protein